MDEPPLDESDPEGDRQHVLDILAGRRARPKTKAVTLAFIARMTKAHNTDLLSGLPASAFPAIRREMEKEFPDVAPLPVA